MSFDVSEQEWEYAKNHCKEGEKLDKKHHKDIQHSFFMINGEIYAFDKGKENYLGQGAFGRVKKCKTQSGKVFAVKIEGITEDAYKFENQAEIDIMQTLGRIEAQAKRTLPEKQFFLEKRWITEKKYLIQAYIPGANLPKYVEKEVPRLERLRQAREAAVKIGELHALGFVHRDIKPDNFIFQKNGNHIQLVAIDFGLSGRIDEPLQVAGSQKYMAPECFIPKYFEDIKTKNPDKDRIDNELDKIEGKRYKQLSFDALKDLYESYGSPEYAVQLKTDPSQDIFSLGVMFKDTYALDDDFFKSMVSREPQQRPNITACVSHLEAEIAKELKLNEKDIRFYFDLIDDMNVLNTYLQQNDNWNKFESKDMFTNIDKMLNEPLLSQINIIKLSEDFNSIFVVDYEVSRLIFETRIRRGLLRASNFEEIEAIMKRVPGPLQQCAFELIAQMPAGKDYCERLFATINPNQTVKNSVDKIVSEKYSHLCQKVLRNIVANLPAKSKAERLKGVVHGQKAKLSFNDRIADVLKKNRTPEDRIEGIIKLRNALRIETTKLEEASPKSSKIEKYRQFEILLKSQLQPLLKHMPLKETPAHKPPKMNTP